MLDDKNALYNAFSSKDTRLDGRFFVGISSTGIYCRPVCPAKTAKIDNCTFFGSAAEAERAGYRPCLKCRPELAPTQTMDNRTGDLARRVARLLEENCQGDFKIADLAGQLGYSSRHLRRVFFAHYRVTPIEYLQTCRLLLAKNLLTETSLPVIDVAMAAGFGSLRRFNDLFKERYRLTPTGLRQKLPQNRQSDSVTLSLGYRPPYLWDSLLDFFAGRAISGVETVRDGSYFRTVSLKTKARLPVQGWLEVKNNPQNNTLSVTVSACLLPLLPQIIARLKRQFDLHCDPETVFATLTSLNEIKPGLCRNGTRVPGCFDAFEMAVRAVLGQQITVKAASTLAARIAQSLGTPLATGIEGLTHVFPDPAVFLELGEGIEDRLGSLGVTGTRSRTIRELAHLMLDGAADLAFSPQPEEKIKKLTAISGIGEWTAGYIAMRAMNYTDVLLATDYGVKKVLQPLSVREIKQVGEKWRPWRSYATINIWNWR